jgi:hypothetical protein
MTKLQGPFFGLSKKEFTQDEINRMARCITNELSKWFEEQHDTDYHTTTCRRSTIVTQAPSNKDAMKALQTLHKYYSKPAMSLPLCMCGILSKSFVEAIATDPFKD